MVSQELLDILRCPLDPAGSRLSLTEDGLVCQRCQLVFPIREGIPCMLPEEARLPEGCRSLDDLPCRRESRSKHS
ncbi:MAG: Trm112 family protein [Gemmataceae bacterium]